MAEEVALGGRFVGVADVGVVRRTRERRRVVSDVEIGGCSILRMLMESLRTDFSNRWVAK